MNDSYTTHIRRKNAGWRAGKWCVPRSQKRLPGKEMVAVQVSAGKAVEVVGGGAGGEVELGIRGKELQGGYVRGEWEQGVTRKKLRLRGRML